MKMWRDIDFPVIGGEKADLSAYWDALRRTYDNGKVVHKTFAIPEQPDFLDFASRGALHAIYFFERFWGAASVVYELPFELREVNFLSSDTFREIHPVELAGSLAARLAEGGAYSTNVPPGRTALDLGRGASEELLAGNFDGPSVFVSYAAWTAFFYGPNVGA
jgi:hypothetical protein